MLKILNVFMQVENNPKVLISKNQQKMTSHTKQAMYKIRLWGRVGEYGVEEGLKRTVLIFILTWVWSTSNQVLGPSCSHTRRAEEPPGLSHTCPRAARGG